MSQSSSLVNELLARERFLFASRALQDDGALHVVRFSGQEGLNMLYSFDITLATRESSLPMEDMLSSGARLSIVRDNGSRSSFSGFPTKIVQTSRYNDWTFYELTLQPGFWYYSRITQNNFFINKNVQQILSECLDRINNYNLTYEFRLSRDYPVQEFSMQHNESMYDYMAWKMERDGISYYFSESDQGEHLIFTDSRLAHEPLAATSSLRYSPVSGMEHAHREEVVTSFSLCCMPLPQWVILRDYNWLNPNEPVQGKALVSEKGLGEVYFYGEGFTTTAEGNRLAEIRAESLRCQARHYMGTSSVPTLRPGFNFTLTNHYDPSCNADYTLTSIRHEGSQEALLSQALSLPLEHPDKLYYRNSFSCISADMQFRPQRVTRRSKVSGMITAFIDASSDTGVPEISSTGCYKVVFPQDTSGRSSGKASCWIRRMQPQAGLGYGTTLPLAPGVEVLIAFMDGDPDRPVIAGAVSNPESGFSESPDSAQNAGLRTAGGNGLVFNDSGTKQGILLKSGGRSGIMMASGSLDAYMQYSDSTTAFSSTLSESFAGLAQNVGGGFASSLSASQKKWKTWGTASTVLKTIAKLASSFGKPQGTKGDNNIATGLSVSASAIKALLQIVDFAQSDKEDAPKYAASLTAKSDKCALKLQTNMEDSAQAKFIAFSTINILANLAASSQGGASLKNQEEKSAEAWKKLEKARQNYDALEDKEGWKADKAREALASAEKAHKTSLDDIKKAKHKLSRDMVQSGLETLLPEILSMILFYKKANILRTGSPKGILIQSPESTLVTQSDKESMLLSSKSIGLCVHPGAEKLITDCTPEQLAARYHVKDNSICLLGERIEEIGLENIDINAIKNINTVSSNLHLSTKRNDTFYEKLSNFNIGSFESAQKLKLSQNNYNEQKNDQACFGELTIKYENNKNTSTFENSHGSLNICNTPKDTDDSLTMTNKSNGGIDFESSLVMDKNGISLKDAYNSLVFAHEDKLTLASDASNALTISGKDKKIDLTSANIKLASSNNSSIAVDSNIELNTQGNLKLSSPAGLTINGSTLELKGKVIKLDADALAQLG